MNKLCISYKDIDTILLKLSILTELLCEELKISADYLHSHVLSTYDRLGFLEKYLQQKDSYETLLSVPCNDLCIDSYENFNRQILDDETYRQFIYDNIKDKLLT
jgi:hypothetical protein